MNGIFSGMAADRAMRWRRAWRRLGAELVRWCAAPDVDIADHQVTLRVAKPRYKLADLLAQCDPKAPRPDLGCWDNAAPVGQELW
jgi:hypothetical protein